ncbi:LamG domain-containing protein [Schumannella luteola]|uniref:Signal peptidase I n=1 Tax=Schumannella luteola TaxID=472059 RepID=A0A852YEY0_9MICO|nr:LamG-like jellyroll fold domain-containing protein [Schumannella luteola]NYG98267.1 signal peptidase I [Schumannella luteola]TPX05710.1 hypothetical protein FJ656_04520 [Schumannella luteola]
MTSAPSTATSTVAEVLAPVTGSIEQVVARVARREIAWGDWARLVFATLARTLLFSIIGALLWTALPTAFGWTSTTVMSNSMAPRFFAGDVIVSMPAAKADLVPGRVILVDDPDHEGRLRMHRLERVEDGKYFTKGDANPEADSSPVTLAHIHGIAVLRAPLVALPIVWTAEHRWMLDAAAAIGLASLVILAGTDRHLRRRRDENDVPISRPRRRNRGRTARLGVGVAALLTTSAMLVAGQAHSAFASTGASNAANGFAAQALGNDWCAGTTGVTAPLDSPTFSWRFNEGGGTVAGDTTANARTGTFSTSGVARVAGACSAGGSYITLNGSGSVNPTSATATATPNTYSIEAWFNAPTNSTGGRIIGYGNSQTGTSGSYDRHVYMNSLGQLTFGVYSGGYKTATSLLSYKDGAWHHMVAVMDGTTGGAGTGMKLYVDGTLVASLAQATSEGTTGFWRVGADNIGGWPLATTPGGFVGSIDNAAVYSTALTQAQVTAHKNAGR